MATVLHLGKYYPPTRGGIETVTEVLATAAARDGHDTGVLCFSRTPGRRVEQGVAVTECGALVTIASQPIGLKYLFQAIFLGRRSDIVHLHAPNFVAALACLFLGRGPKLVVHWHSDVIAKGLLYVVMAPLEYLLLLRATSVICTSPVYAEASVALRRFRGKITVIPIGIPEPATETYTPPRVSSAIRHFLRGRRFILSVGRLVTYKGFDVLIDAVSRFPSGTAAVIVGDGPQRAELERRIREARVEECVLLAGTLDEDELRALYASAALFCMPSVERSEAFGVVLLEAMARGLPVVATQIPGSGVPWVNVDGVSGTNVPIRDPGALAEACSRLLIDSDAAHRLARGARARYEQRFTLNAFCSSVLTLYSALLAGPPFSPRGSLEPQA
jgi:glycosyltransferase involved in cell wall biosynthesis